MSTDAWNRQRRRWHDRDPPSGRRCGRLSEIHCLRLPAPAPERDADRPSPFGCELKAPGSCHGEAGEFADHSAKPAVAKSLFHAGEHGLVVARLDIDHPVRDEPRLGDRRREQVWPRDAPEDLAPRASRDSCAEQRCRRAIDGAIAAAGDLMKCAKRQPTARQTRIDLGDPERERRSCALRTAFDPFDLRAQGIDCRLRLHAVVVLRSRAASSFALCSNSVTWSQDAVGGRA